MRRKLHWFFNVFLSLFLSVAAGIPAIAAEIQATSTSDQTLHLPEDTEQILDSLVLVQNGDELGSGVLINPNGYLLTAAHVVKDEERVAVHLRSGQNLDGKVLRRDALLDLALVKIPGRGLRSLPLQEAEPEEGQMVYGVGLLLEEQRLTYYITPGKALAQPVRGLLRCDADLPVGNSGGPFLNERGEVVGLIAWKVYSKKDQATTSYGADVASLRKFLRGGAPRISG
jgi:S1-C subfamily serine protease